MKIDWRKEVTGLLLIGLAFVTSGINWFFTPDRIPIHWNFAGEPDVYGSKAFGLWILPVVAVALYALLLLLPRLDSRRAGFGHFEATYRIIRNTLMALITGVNFLAGMSARGIAVDIGMVIPLLVGLSAVVIGNYLGKLRPNGTVGIRTPWTLASKESWNKTHRLGGGLFVAIGLGIVLAGLIGTTWAYLTLFVTVGGSLTLLAVYSYRIWKTDPDKEQSRRRENFSVH